MVQPLDDVIIALPSSLNSTIYVPPSLSLHLPGPMKLFFPSAKNDIGIRIPHLVEAPNIKKFELETGAEVEVSGLKGFHLVDPVTVELKWGNEDLSVHFRNSPRLEIFGDMPRISSIQRLKAKRNGIDSILFTNTSSDSKASGINFPLSSSWVQQILLLLSQEKSLPRDRSTPHIQILEAEAQVVTLFTLPVQLEERDSGLRSWWHLSALRDTEGEIRVFQHKEFAPVTQISILPALLENGTFSQILGNFPVPLGDQGVEAH